MPGLKKGSHATRKLRLRWPFVAFSFVFCVQLVQLIKNMRSLHKYRLNFVLFAEETEDISIHFWEKSNSCFQLKSICHGNDRWFYDGSSLKELDAKYQPMISYMKDKDMVRGVKFPDYNVYFNVSSYHGREEQCSYSPTPYHVVVQSPYNEMIGEFYRRSIPGLNQLLKNYPAKSEEEVQLYLDFFAKGKQEILHGHRLFLGGLPQTFNVDTFLSLIQDDSCQCFETLAFCGYTVRNISNPGVENTTKSFIPFTHIQSNSTSTYAELRQDILETHAKRDPMLNQKVRNHRHQLLLQRGVREEEIGNLDEWKIIGLTDRKYRRIWLNIDDAIKSCNKFKGYKVICTKLNVEEAESPQGQLLMHASLNSMIGVHGSQFTNGVFLPPHSFILELLPWMKYLEDAPWVASTSCPTPMGDLFHDSNIHNLGYCLGRKSVPLCEHVDEKDEELEKACLTNKTSGVGQKYDWYGRNFNVDVDIVDKFVSAFLLQNSTNCDEMQRRGDEHGFILYNVFCSHTVNGAQSEFSAKHYYRKARHCEY